MKENSISEILGKVVFNQIPLIREIQEAFIVRIRKAKRESKSTYRRKLKKENFKNEFFIPMAFQLILNF